jgi:hypothetical protein
MTTMRALLLGVFLALSGCTLLAEPKATDRIAVVRAGHWGGVYRGGYVEVESVSGVQMEWRLHAAIAVPAGEHSAMLSVYLCNGGRMNCVPIARNQVSFLAKVDTTYQAHAQEQVNGSNRFWVWVEDEGSGQVVGGTRPPKS